jgi:hypothetical protein
VIGVDEELKRTGGQHRKRVEKRWMNGRGRRGRKEGESNLPL